MMTRPDIANALRACARHSHNPSPRYRGISGPLAKGGMSRVRKVVAPEGKGTTPQEEPGIDSKLELIVETFLARLDEKFQQMMTDLEDRSSRRCTRFEERLTRVAQSCSAGQTKELPETSTQRHGASKDGVTQDTPQTGTQMLQGKGQPITGRHGEEQDQVSASRPGFRDEKRSEPGGESIRGGPSNPSQPNPSNLHQQQSGRHDEIHCLIVRPSEGDHNRDACPDRSALRDPLCSKGPDVEPVPWSTGFEDGEKPVKQEEAITASPNIEQGWENSSKVAVVYATTTTTKRTVQQRHVLRNRTGVKTTGENKFFDPGGKQVIRALPPRWIPLSGRA